MLREMLVEKLVLQRLKFSESVNGNSLLPLESSNADQSHKNRNIRL